MKSAVMLVIVCALWVKSAGAITLNEALNAAWKRSVAENSNSSKMTYLESAIEAAASFTPSSPYISGEYRNEMLYGTKRNTLNSASISVDGSETSPASVSRETSVNGNELRVGINIPLWLPTQRSKTIEAAKADKNAYIWDFKASKLDLAGELRASVAEIRAADIEIKLAITNVQESAALVGDVKRRLKAGDIAESDLFKAVADEKIAQSELLRARQRMSKAIVVYKNLTGLSEWPNDPEVVAEKKDLSTHPLLLRLKGTLDASKAKEAKIKSEVIDTPEIGLTYSRIINSRISPPDEAVIIGYKIPLPSLSRYKAKTSEAGADRSKAAVQYLRESDKIQISIDSALRELELASAELESMQEAAESTQQVYLMTKKAFDLGETDLSSLLKALYDRRRAILRFESARLSKDIAIASYNQNAGVIP